MILQRLIKLYILKHHNCRCLPAVSLSCLGKKGSKEAHKGRAPCIPHNFLSVPMLLMHMLKNYSGFLQPL